MDLEKHPFPTQFSKLLDRLTEECAELIHASCKWKRFHGRPSPKSGKKAVEMIRSEIEDVKKCLAEVERRLENM